MPLVSSGSTSEAPPQPLFPEIRFGDKHGFPVATYVLCVLRESSSRLACLKSVLPRRGGAAREGKEDVPQVQSLSVRVCMANDRRNLFELVKVN